MRNYISFILFSIVFIWGGCAKDDASVSESNTGQGGSLAQFSIVENYLYVVDNEDLKVFDITQTNQPTLINEQQVGFGIETLFRHKDHLFIGSESGMFIYNISNKAQPVFISDYQHIESCDPVVANDSVAFVTLRSGRQCRFTNDLNVLDVLDISDINNPQPIGSYFFDNPHGLGLVDSMLVVCDGESGFRVLNAKNPYQLEFVAEISGLHVNDVIPQGNRIMLVGPENLYQYDLSNPYDPQLISTIDILNF